MNVQKHLIREWLVDDVRIVSEDRPGRFNIPDWMHLDEAGLRRVHAVIGEVLAELAEPVAADRDNGDVI